MSAPQVFGKRRALSASEIRDAIAKDLSSIKHEDRLTFADIGRVLGKSEDMAAKYCDGTAVMDAITYTLARDQWNGRFTGSVDNLVNLGKSKTCDRGKLSAILSANLALSVALQDDGEASPAEVRKMRKELNEARDAIDELLNKLSVRAA